MIKNDIIHQITGLLKEHAADVLALKAKVRTLTRQRDQAQGTAREYRAYATKYQKELAELRKELRQNG
jgi:peptidoglycan hydrolase CwlO-like protein